MKEVTWQKELGAETPGIRSHVSAGVGSLMLSQIFLLLSSFSLTLQGGQHCQAITGA